MSPIGAPLLACAPRLRYVLQFGVGLEARLRGVGACCCCCAAACCCWLLR
jgi:hypothetical protein